MKTLLSLVGALSMSLSAAIPTADTVTNSMGMKFKRIPAGIFMMGYEGDTLPPAMWSAFGGNSYFKTGLYREKPRHEVIVTDDFYMGVYEVQIGDFKKYNPAIMDRYGYWDPKGDNMPVYNETWYEADSFCKWLTTNDPNGWTYRLPTEAEWEYACRAGTTTRYYWGDTLTANSANFSSGAYNWALEPVGGYAPNPWGLFDMLGNAVEWCADWYGPYAAENDTNPGGYVTGACRLQKGLPSATPAYQRCAFRAADHPWMKSARTGFRVVITGTTPVLKARTDDTLAVWQRIISQPRPAPVAAVSGATYVDGDGRAFSRVALKPVVLHPPYPTQRDSVAYVSQNPVGAPDNNDRKSAGLLARALSLKYGVLYRVSNRYELAFAGIDARAGEYYLTVVPDLAYQGGQPHPDVNYFRQRYLQAITPPSVYNGSDRPFVAGMVYGHMLKELPNGALCVGAANGVSEEDECWKPMIALLPNGADAWSEYFAVSERPGNWDDQFGIYGDPWTGRLWMKWGTSQDNGMTWTFDRPSPGIGSYGDIFPLNGDTLQYLAHYRATAYRSTDSGRTWTQATSGLGYDTWAYQACQLDDGRLLDIPRNVVVDPAAAGQFTFDVRTGTTDTMTGPFARLGCCSLSSRLIKLHSGRLLFFAMAAGGYAVGESVDSGRHWFARRVIADVEGEGEVCQSRDGLIHVLFEHNRFAGGDHNQVSFSEQWLREGTVLPFSQWGVAGYENRADTTVMEPGYLPPLGTRNESRITEALSISLSASPNPFNPSTTLQYALTDKNGLLRIHDMQGRILHSFSLTEKNGKVEWNGKQRPSGCYMARLVSGKQTKTIRLLLMK